MCNVESDFSIIAIHAKPKEGKNLHVYFSLDGMVLSVIYDCGYESIQIE